MSSLKYTFLFFLCASCYIGEELPTDQQIWEYDNPGNVGLSEVQLISIDSLIKLNAFERISGLMVIKDDKMVFENYYDSTNRHTIFSLDKVTITLTIAAVGVAIDKGLLNLEDPIHQYLPSYESIFDQSVSKRDITIRHLLTHRSGLSWNENLVPFFGNPDHDLNQMFASSDWVSFILNQPLEADPGFRYNFNSGAGVILARIIQNLTNQPFDEFLNENIFNELGVTTFSINQDPSGNFDGGRGASISFLDWTKFGYLMLENGIWNDRRIIDPNFVAEASSVQIPVSGSLNLGYGWRLFGENFDFLPIDRNEIYYIGGDIGQHQYIIPSHDMIIQINAANFFFFDFNNPSLNLFIAITNTIQ